MKRQTLTDGSGIWFDRAAAVRFDEDTRWNGNNHISVATGSQWDHEALYYTKSGRWVLYSWSQWQGSLDTWKQVDEAAAVRWLSANNCHADDGMDHLPESIREAVDAGLAKLEL